jgi:ankyrin repeat protein
LVYYATKDGDTALTFAAEEGYEHIVQYLVDHLKGYSAANIDREIMEGIILHLVDTIETIKACNH